MHADFACNDVERLLFAVSPLYYPLCVACRTKPPLPLLTWRFLISFSLQQQQSKKDKDITDSKTYKLIHGIDQPKPNPSARAQFAFDRAAGKGGAGGDEPEGFFKNTPSNKQSRSFKVLQWMTDSAGADEPDNAPPEAGRLHSQRFGSRSPPITCAAPVDNAMSRPLVEEEEEVAAESPAPQSWYDGTEEYAEKTYQMAVLSRPVPGSALQRIILVKKGPDACPDSRHFAPIRSRSRSVEEEDDSSVFHGSSSACSPRLAPPTAHPPIKQSPFYRILDWLTDDEYKGCFEDEDNGKQNVLNFSKYAFLLRN